MGRLGRGLPVLGQRLSAVAVAVSEEAVMAVVTSRTLANLRGTNAALDTGARWIRESERIQGIRFMVPKQRQLLERRNDVRRRRFGRWVAGLVLKPLRYGTEELGRAVHRPWTHQVWIFLEKNLEPSLKCLETNRTNGTLRNY